MIQVLDKRNVYLPQLSDTGQVPLLHHHKQPTAIFSGKYNIEEDSINLHIYIHYSMKLFF